MQFSGVRASGTGSCKAGGRVVHVGAEGGWAGVGEKPL